MKPRELHTNFTTALNAANTGFGVAIASTYIDSLNSEDADFARQYTVAESEKRKTAAANVTAFLTAAEAFRLELNQPLADDVDALSKDLNTFSKQALSQMIELTRTMLNDGRYDVKQIELMNAMGSALQNVYRNPKSADLLAAFAVAKNNLASHMETGSFSHHAYNLGRALLGTLEAVLGVAVIIAGLVTGIGFALILGSLIYSTMKGNKAHWGPLTWGNQLFWKGIDTMKSGPTFFQRDAAIRVSNELKAIDGKIKEIQAPVAAPSQPNPDQGQGSENSENNENNNNNQQPEVQQPVAANNNQQPEVQQPVVANNNQPEVQQPVVANNNQQPEVQQQAAAAQQQAAAAQQQAAAAQQEEEVVQVARRPSR